MGRASKGKIIHNFIVACGAAFCDRATSVRVTDLESAERELISRGWGQGGDGWLCPECNGKLKTDPEDIVPGLTAMSRIALSRLRMDISSEIALSKITQVKPAVLAGLTLKLRVIDGEISERIARRSEYEFT